MTGDPRAPELGNRLLIVDDEEGMRHMLRTLLGHHGFVVSEASDGQAALERLSAGDVDIVLSDVRMPGLDGVELLARIKQSKAPVTVLMMSAFVDLDTAVAALKAGAADYISKPFKSDEVLLKIRMAQERVRLEEERERLRAENARLRGQGSAAVAPGGIIGKSKRMADIFATIAKIADFKSTVLLQGESGTGKELVARALHDLSVRRKQPFVPINCGAIPATLLESELFGHVKGAFTDATRNKKGLIEEADGGTLFLDEIGELPLLLQVKLLRFLQEEEIRRVGDNRAQHVDVRVIAATARELAEMVGEGTFREDLYYRLNVLQIRIPPLRERRDDIPHLVEHFVAKYGARLGRDPMTVSREALRALMDYPWPGNVRELENTIERAMVLADADRIDVEDLPEKLRERQDSAPQPLLGDDLSIKKATRAIERELIRRALEKTKGNRTRAAALLELSHRALLYKLKEYNLS